MLRQGLERGLPVQNLMENWDFLQVQGGCWELLGVTEGQGMSYPPGPPLLPEGCSPSLVH